MSVDRVYVVFGARLYLGFFLLFVKNGFVVGVRSPKVTATTPAAGANCRPGLPLSQCHGWLVPITNPVHL